MTQLVVLHVCAVEYSARTLLVPQLDFLAANGYQPRLACAPDDDRFKPGLERFDPLAVEFSRSPTPLAVFRSARRLRAVLDEVRPDILHLHSSSAALPGVSTTVLSNYGGAFVHKYKRRIEVQQ